MAILVIFLLGVGNFALHKAVLEYRFQILSQIPGFSLLLGGKISLIAEFFVLLAAMLLVSGGMTGWGWIYLGYSVFNGVAGWMILTRRI